jgi:ribonuclease R
MGSKKKKKSGIENQLKQAILEVFKKNNNHPLNYKQVCAVLDIHDTFTRNLISDILVDLKNNAILGEVERGKYKLNEVKSAYFTGRLELTAKGAAFLISEESEEDIFIAPRFVRTALNGDIVKVRLLAKRQGSKPEAEVIEIVQRTKTEYAGIIQLSKNFAFLIPDDNRMPVDIFIPLSELKGAKNGQKVIVKMTGWAKGATSPEGEVLEVLGEPGQHEAEMHAILAEYGLPYRFPEKVEKAAEKLDVAITENEIAKRKDFRNTTTFTIDPLDAKDFDDALSIKKLENGNYEIGIHIADVTHYVTPNSIIEVEAQERATSVYLVDRVVPMLPEALSNYACSLRPNEDKYTFSAVFEIDEQANIKNEWFGKTVIHSNRRFTYEEAQTIIENGEGDFAEEILLLDKLAKKFRAKRFKNGSIAFDKVEVKFTIDKQGKPIGVYWKEMKDANKLIEEFMLLANKKVAEFITKPEPGIKKPKRTFVYRIHDTPNPEKLRVFTAFVSKMGYKMNLKNNLEIARSFNSLLEDVSGKTEQNMVEQLAIRTMAKAIYSTKNVGHYGLAFEYYTHFTSPIRRYPDMMVHRLLHHYLESGNSPEVAIYEKLCKHSSEMEKVAADAERASIKYKQVEYLSDKIGKEFEGVISGVTEWGLFVEIIENKCEGIIRLRDLDDDYYIFDEENYQVVGKRHGNKYRMGDTVSIMVKKADLTRKQIDFVLLG